MGSNGRGYSTGFKEYAKAGVIGELPKLFGFQAEGAAPLVKGQAIENPETIATAIRIGNPASRDLAMAALRESFRLVEAVSDDEIVDAYKKLANTEGIFAEPASCASLAGIIKLKKQGLLEKGKQVVCVLTGNGLKDPNIALEAIGGNPLVVEGTIDSVMGVIKS